MVRKSVAGRSDHPPPDSEDGRQHYSRTPEQRDPALAKLDWLKNDAYKRRRELGIEPLYREREHWKARFW